jgi:hypothetical protein
MLSRLILKLIPQTRVFRKKINFFTFFCGKTLELVWVLPHLSVQITF